jgi:bisphosphoglycerate-independent phosphoglycerate mutase (AlkP superfamily)
MLSKDRSPKLFSALFSLILFFSFSTFPVASAFTEIKVSPVNTPEGAVVLIVDGFSASYIYPELTPLALDGTTLEKARLEFIPKMSENSARILEFRVPQTFTEGGHSVLITGNPGADAELVSFKDATVYDVLHKNGYLCIAVMEKGDFGSICAEQDVIARDANNSINDMKIMLENYDHSSDTPEAPEIPEGLLNVLKDAADKAPGYVKSKETRERYSGYNRWGIDTACAVVKYMSENRPGQKYLLTVNVGAVDDSGHHRDNYGYIDCIECLDADLPPFYEICKKNNLAFFLTADHGMAFSKNGARGGHQSEKLSASEESQLVPLIVHAHDVKNGIIRGKHNQEDFAPTLLSILDIPDRPRFAKGKQIMLTGHTDLKVILPENGSAELIKDGEQLTSANNDEQFLFLGLEPGSTYKIRAALDSGKNLEVQEKEICLESDSVIEFQEQGHKEQENVQSGSGLKGNANLQAGSSKGSYGTSGSSGFLDSISGNWIAYLLIGMINLVGLVIIAKLLKKN